MERQLIESEENTNVMQSQQHHSLDGSLFEKIEGLKSQGVVENKNAKAILSQLDESLEELKDGLSKFRGKN